MELRNILSDLPPTAKDEVAEVLAAGGEFQLKRIVSAGQSTPPGEWYDQEYDEWVMVLAGAGRLEFEGRDERLDMQPGDCVHIPAHCRHRVDWTDPDCETVWLALYYRSE